MAFEIVSDYIQMDLDFGDAPDGPYPTLLRAMVQDIILFQVYN